MSQERPALSELRARVHKDRHREIGNWLARRLGRPSAVYGCWLAIRLGVSAHQVTLAALGCSIGAALAIGSGGRWLFVAGVSLAHLAFWLDHVDGQVARWRSRVTLDGVYFDYLFHHVTNLALGFALGYGLAMRTGEARWAIAGFCIAAGWALLSLHNDCRYKAFFQRLKSTKGSFVVDGGSGEAPEPPAPWPRRGRGALTWPAYKACEFHVVLVTLCGLALVAMASPRLWFALWRGWVCVSAVLAPALAIARSARVITRGAVEHEFARWFRWLEPVEQARTSAAAPPHVLNGPPAVSEEPLGAPAPRCP